MKRDAEHDFARDRVLMESLEEQFKTMVLATDREVFKALYRDDFAVPDEDLESEDFEWIQPQSEADVQKLMHELRQASG